MSLTRREIIAATAAAGVVHADLSFPQVPFGAHRISRLIAGGNPVSGNSHVDSRMSRDMMDYFTAANTKKMLADCERTGINTWQSRGDRHIQRLLHEYRNEGGRILWIAQTASELADLPRHIQDCAAKGAAGIYHHGARTDRLWANGRIDQVRDSLKVIRDSGVRVGLGTHIPEVIDYVEEKGWDVDFYMTCVYNLSRTAAEAAKVAGHPVDGEFFSSADREQMLSRVKKTKKQCLIFKVYGASRHCASPADMLAALRLAASSAKPHDCVVIGMFPKYKDQVAENRRLFLEAFRPLDT